MAKLILMGSGKAMFVPDVALSADEVQTISEAFKAWSGDPKKLLAVMGMPVEIVDNRPKPKRSGAPIEVKVRS